MPMCHKAIIDANSQQCVVDRGITVDDIVEISADEMHNIEDEFNIEFVCIGNNLLIKINM